MSRLDDFVTAVEAQFDDSTVSFEAGRVRKTRHGQRRRVIFQRRAGALVFSTGPGRHATGTPVSGVGDYTDQKFQRQEVVEVTLRAEDEDALDTMLDRLIDAIFVIAGPNVFEERSQYEWVEGDSSTGGTNSARQPAIRLLLTLKLKSVPPQPGQFVKVTDADAVLSEGDEDVTVDIS